MNIDTPEDGAAIDPIPSEARNKCEHVTPTRDECRVGFVKCKKCGEKLGWRGRLY